jgi:hypothetical protein
LIDITNATSQLSDTLLEPIVADAKLRKLSAEIKKVLAKKNVVVAIVRDEV